MIKGKLKKTEFNTISQTKFEETKRSGKKKIVVFVIGGVTYQENRELQAAAQLSNFEIIVGSNIIINSEK